MGITKIKNRAFVLELIDLLDKYGFALSESSDDGVTVDTGDYRDFPLGHIVDSDHLLELLND